MDCTFQIYFLFYTSFHNTFKYDTVLCRAFTLTFIATVNSERQKWWEIKKVRSHAKSFAVWLFHTSPFMTQIDVWHVRVPGIREIATLIQFQYRCEELMCEHDETWTVFCDLAWGILGLIIVIQYDDVMRNPTHISHSYAWISHKNIPPILFINFVFYFILVTAEIMLF